MSPPIGGVRAGYISGQQDAIPDSEIDHFNRDTLNNDNQYSGDTSLFTTQTTTVAEGSHALVADVKSDTGPYVITSTSGLNVYPERGVEIEYQFNFAGAKSELRILFGVQSENGLSNGSWYEAIHHNNNEIILQRRDSGGVTTLDSVAVSNYDPDTWYQGRILWDDPTITVEDGTNSKSVSADDSNYNSGGVGIIVTARGSASGDGDDSYIDEFRTGSSI